MTEPTKDNRNGQTGIPRWKSSTKIPPKVEVRLEDSNSCNDGKQKQKGAVSEGLGKGLSLQGPFNPNIVGRKHADKRKKPDNGGKFLSSVKSVEDLASKRSVQSEKEKQKYVRNFSNKVETKFAGGEPDDKKPVQFTAKGPSVPFKTKGYRELKKSEEELQKKVLHLEVSLRDLDLLRNDKVTSLNKQLTEANEKAGSLEEELNHIKEEYGDYKTTSTTQFQTQESSFLKTNKHLQDKVDSCIKKLQECDIDPVSLENLDVNQKAIEEKRLKAVDQAMSLQEKLKELSEKNRSLMENIQNCIEGSG